MVIGIEGNVHVGKTTYIKNNYKEFKVLSENIFNSDLNDYDRQLDYINQEIGRKNELSSNMVLDRTILSILIYTLHNNVLSKEEKRRICNIIKSKITKKEVIIPDYINLIIYPYKLICKNHSKLCKEKGTQNTLVDYDYYLKYNSYFAKRSESFDKVLSTGDYRQVLVYNNSIFNSAIDNIDLDSKVLLDGCPAIGKTTIGKKQKKYNYIEEFKYKRYTLDDYRNQIDSIVERINALDNKNILLDTSFLMGITHLFYNDKASKKMKLEMVDEIISRVKLNSYITKIVYLMLDKDKIIERKEKDKSKERLHFYDNLNYLDCEINFYSVLDKKLGKMSNISFIDASTSVDEIIKKIESIEDKPLMLIDLFYEIKEGIKGGEL